MRLLLTLAKGLLVSLAGIALGGLAGWGIAYPRAPLIIPSLAAGSSLGITLASPPAGVAVLLLMAPISEFAHLDLRLAPGVPAFTLARVISSFLLMLLLVRVSAGQQKWTRFTPVEWAFVAAILGIGLSLARSLEPVRSFQVFFDSYIVPYLMYFLGKNIIRDRIWLDRILLVLVVVGLYLSGLIIYEHFTGEAPLVPEGDFANRYSQNLRRSTVVFGNSAFSGVLLSIIFPIGVFLLMQASSPRSKALLSLAVPVLALGLFFTYTRASWLSALIAVVALQFFFPSLRRFLLPGLALGALGALVFWDNLASNPIYSERISSEGPITGRLFLYDLGVQFFWEKPIWGIGFNNFGPIAATSQVFEVGYPHDSFLFILISSGLIGLLPYLASFILILRDTVAGTRRLGASQEGRVLAPLWIFLISYLGNALVIDVVSFPYLNMVFFLFVGCYLGLLESLKTGDLALVPDMAGDRRGDGWTRRGAISPKGELPWLD